MTGAGLLGLCGTAELRIIGACPEDFLGYMAGVIDLCKLKNDVLMM